MTTEAHPKIHGAWDILGLLGPSVLTATPNVGSAGRWQFLLLSAPSVRIASGTDEIQRNILAERSLGLPRDPRPLSA